MRTLRFGGEWFLSIPVWRAPSDAPRWSRALERLAAHCGLAIERCPKENAGWWGTACTAGGARVAFEPSQVGVEGDVPR
jgi:hypothetical protein